MRAEPEENLRDTSRRKSFPIVELCFALCILAGLVIYWYWSDDATPDEPVAKLPPVVTPAQPVELPTTPDIPEREEIVAAPAIVDVDTEEQTPADVTVTETVEDGDTILREQLTVAGAGPSLNKLINSEHPLDLSAALVDGLGRGIILRKMLPAEPPKQAFEVEREGNTIYMSPASYKRYDSYTDAITALDTGLLVETFHSLRPLYETAYNQLGLDPDDFDNAIIRTLDLVLATPEISDPIELNPKSVVYVYADPALESLPAVQKQLLRVGPDNLRRIKQQARMLREGLLAQ